MSSVIERLQKRRRWPVDLGDNSKVYIRAMTKREKMDLNTIKAADDSSLDEKSQAADSRAYFIIGTVQLNDDGSQAFARNEGESAKDFATRIEAALIDVPEDSIALLIQAWSKAESVPSVEKLSKN